MEKMKTIIHKKIVIVKVINKSKIKFTDDNTKIFYLIKIKNNEN